MVQLECSVLYVVCHRPRNLQIEPNVHEIHQNRTQMCTGNPFGVVSVVTDTHRAPKFTNRTHSCMGSQPARYFKM
eukprot:COSAG01_NODE_12778_length_1687_cov_1.578086_2_plen_75_part_00